MSGSHNKDDLVKDMLTMVDDMLADMCGLIVKTIALIRQSTMTNVYQPAPSSST